MMGGGMMGGAFTSSFSSSIGGMGGGGMGGGMMGGGGMGGVSHSQSVHVENGVRVVRTTRVQRSGEGTSTTVEEVRTDLRNGHTTSSRRVHHDTPDVGSHLRRL
jgi:hypothetical protein